MSDKDQAQIIQEQRQANERFIRAIEKGEVRGIFKGKAPANERIKQMKPNERADSQPQPPEPQKDKSN